MSPRDEQYRTPGGLYLVSVTEVRTFMVPTMAPNANDATDRAVERFTGLPVDEQRKLERSHRIYSTYVVRGDGLAGL